MSTPSVDVSALNRPSSGSRVHNKIHLTTDSEKDLAGAGNGLVLNYSCPTAFEANDRDCIRPTVCRWSLSVRVFT